MELSQLQLKCQCRGNMKKIQTDLKGIPVRGWSCNRCGEVLIHPKDADMAVSLYNAKKRKELEVKVREVGDSQVVTIPKIIREYKDIKKGMILEWGIEDSKLTLHPN